MGHPRVFKIDDVWVLEWPTFGFQPEPVLTAYESWADAVAASGRQVLGGRDGVYSLAERPLLSCESDRWSMCSSPGLQD
jgi:hypothetical protein